MKRTVWLWQLFGFAVTALGGTVLHFLYEFLGRAIWIAPFSGVNESTWEHMKLLFWPMLAFAVVQSFFFRERKDFWCIKLRGILLGLVSIPVLFYTYNGLFGKSPDFINIIIFFIAAAITYMYEAIQFRKTPASDCKKPVLAIGILSGIAVMFIIFTFATPKIPLFKDPMTDSYGILQVVF